MAAMQYMAAMQIRNAICGAICDFAFGTEKIIYVCGVARFGPTNIFEKAH